MNHTGGKAGTSPDAFPQNRTDPAASIKDT